MDSSNYNHFRFTSTEAEPIPPLREVVRNILMTLAVLAIVLGIMLALDSAGLPLPGSEMLSDMPIL